MFRGIINTIILTIFILIIFHFIIEHTRNIWYIPKNENYDGSYKKIVELLDTLPDTPEPPNKKLEINSEDSMENELNEYISNMT
jgi:hypothetical protein